MLLGLGTTAVVFACGQPFGEELPAEDDSIPAAAADAGATSDVVEAGAALRFSACPGGYSGACAKVPMPLDWGNASGKTIDVLVDKISTTPRPKAQLWLLQGGPGGSAADMVPLGRDLADRTDDLEVFTIEHRGVGASNRIGCAAQEAAAQADPAAFDLMACANAAIAAHGDDLRHYTTTNAARDLVRAIELTRREGVKVFVFGVSYGTYWAQRMMQLSPTIADGGVILDSLVMPGEQVLSKFDPQADVVAQKLADTCKSDPSCNAALGPDPWAKIVAAKTKLEQGHCPGLGMDPVERVELTTLLRIHIAMGYALAAWHRIDRCTAEDVAAVKLLLSRLPFRGPSEALSSGLLGINIMVSEMFESPFPTKQTMQQRFDDTVFPAGIALDYDVLAAWPRYAPDAFAGKLPDPKVPVLVLAGTLDSQTPIELQEKAKAVYQGPGRTFVTVPNANHGVINQSPMFTANGPPRQCGMQLTLAFLRDPTAALDTSCAAQVLAPTFSRPLEEVQYLFGTSDMWLGVPAAPPDFEPKALADVRLLPRLPLRGSPLRASPGSARRPP